MAEGEKMGAIECLLTAENDLRPGVPSGVVRLNTSQLFAPAQVNLAALYMISYIYTGDLEHAAAVALRGGGADGTDAGGYFYVTRANAIRSAYRAYRLWFAKVRQMGLANAQRAGLQPLDGTGLRWY